jgi:hypothetical protein
MTLNQPMSSSSHWRIPTTSAPHRHPRRRTLHTTLTQVSVPARVAARPAWRAIVASLLIGGVLVAPLLVVVALVALVAPPLEGVRQLAPALIFVSLLWLGLAIFGAHAQVVCPPGAHRDANLAERDAEQ